MMGRARRTSSRAGIAPSCATAGRERLSALATQPLRMCEMRIASSRNAGHVLDLLPCADDVVRSLLDGRHIALHVPHDRYLTGAKKLPEPIVFGEESEAVAYTGGERELWASVPRALAWLES